MRVFFWTVLAAFIVSTSAGVRADDRHAGYYYPEPQSFETYQARGDVLPDSDKRRRVGFIVGLTDEMFKRPYAPDYAVFAKGAEAEKMIIVSLRAGFIDNIYRARGFLAQLTAMSRGTELFRQLGVEETFTFYDLARLLGFEQVTISDGESFAHQVTLE